MRRQHLLLLCLLLSCTVRAQFPNHNSKWGITLSPGFVSNPNPTISINPGVEYRPGERFYLLGDIALPIVGLFRDSLQDRTYFRFRAEARYVFNMLNRKRKGLKFFLSKILDYDNYIGIQVSYAYRSFRDVNGGKYFKEKNNDSLAIEFDNANIKSPVFTATLQWGAIYELSNNFYIDLFMGVGVRMVTTRYSKVSNPHDAIYARGRHELFPYAHLYPWTVTRGQLNGGIRFIYRFD
jgi:hypothetical protein